MQNNQDINRVEAQFKRTPIFDDKKVFSGGKIISNTQKVKIFNRVRSASSTAIIASLIGLILAFFYIILSNIFQGALMHKRK